MARPSQLPTPSIKPIAWFHAYVLCSVMGVRWGKHAPAYANSNDELKGILREYLVYACGDDEWTKGRILEAMRCKTGTAMKTAARKAFPSMFPRNKRARPLGVPDELSNEEVSFDTARIEKWGRQVRAIKKEIIMNENATTQEATEAPIDRRPLVDKSDSTEGGTNSRVTINFFIPEGVDPNSLTLENYREVTTKRFRMTKDQKEVRGLTREVAFAESKALAISQLGVE